VRAYAVTEEASQSARRARHEPLLTH
jgi:hypothetical protein